MRSVFLSVFLPVLLLLFGERAHAQDSLQTRRFDSHFYFFDYTTQSNYDRTDSSFNQLPNYFQRNSMGNIGLPSYPFLLSAQDNGPLGVKWFSSPYDSRMMSRRDEIYYSQKGIYTSLFGAAGSKKEQVFKLSHTQNVNERLNFSLRLNRYGALGFYQFQQSFVNNVLFSSNYISKNKRFGYFGSLSFDRFKHQENGGIKSDSVILADNFAQKDLIDVNLIAAKRNYSVLGGSASLFFKLNNDTAGKVNHYIVLGTKGYVNRSIYNDNAAAGYYDTTYKDTVSTHDTTLFAKLTPSLSYNLNTRNSNFELGGQYDWSHWKTAGDSGHYYQSIIALQSFAWCTDDKKLILKERASYVVSGNNAGDYQGSLGGQWQLPVLATELRFKASYEDRSPDLFFNYNSVNNFYWKNAFAKTQSGKAELMLASDKLHLKLGVVYTTTTNMLVLNEHSMPEQLHATILASRVFLDHHLKIYKFHLVNSINYQNTNNRALVLPQLYTQHQLYFEHRIKRNGLKLQVGVQATYISKMDLISYNPALNSFYLYYNPRQGGNYVYTDFFFNVNFRPVKLFFKADHLNQGFMGTNYSMLNGYYQPDRAFHFGLNWEFWD